MIENMDYKDTKSKKMVMVSKFTESEKTTINLAETLSGIWNKTAYVVRRGNEFAVFRDM